MSGGFGWIDYMVVGGTLLFSILIGVYYAVFAKQDSQDLLVGGRKMGIAPIAASMLVTYLSAITVIGTFPKYFWSLCDTIEFIEFYSILRVSCRNLCVWSADLYE